MKRTAFLGGLCAVAVASAGCQLLVSVKEKSEAPADASTSSGGAGGGAGTGGVGGTAGMGGAAGTGATAEASAGGATGADSSLASDAGPDAVLEASSDGPTDAPLFDGELSDAGPDGDAAPPCDERQARCGSVCVSLQSDPGNCGACSHDCGGALCTDWACQPSVVHSLATEPVRDLHVDDTNVYFLTNSQILSCPNSGCVAAPRQVASGVTSTHFVLANGHVAFTADTTTVPVYAAVQLCPGTGCTTPTALVSANKYVAIAGFGGSDTDVFTSSSYTGIYANIARCAAPVGGACSSQNVPVNGMTSSAMAGTSSTLFFLHSSGNLAAVPVQGAGDGGSADPVVLTGTTGFITWVPYGSDVYLLYPGPTSTIKKCAATGCPSGPQTVLSTTFGVSDFVMDASGFYWIRNSAIYTCPLTGCVGGPVLVAAVDPLTQFMQVRGGFVYWAVSVADAGAGATIMRVAKPLVQ